MASKSATIKSHFKKRAAQRLGWYVTEAEIESLIKLIKTQKAKFIERESNTRTHWEMNFRDKNIYVIYDSKYKLPVTCWEVGSKPWYEATCDD